MNGSSVIWIVILAYHIDGSGTPNLWFYEPSDIMEMLSTLHAEMSASKKVEIRCINADGTVDEITAM